MAVYKSKTPTKDGRQYFFRIKYKDIFGVTHDYSSPKFKNKKEAEIEEARYKIKISNKEVLISNITIEQAFIDMLENKKNKLKKQTIIKENNLFKYLEYIKEKKINDINIYLYKELLVKKLPSNLSVNYKNKILGLFKRIVIYSNKMNNTSDSILKFVDNFCEVGKIKNEMIFFEYQEYLEFDKVIKEFDYHTFFEVLYFMGLRKGELQALTWEDIDFEKNTLRINKTLTTKIKGEIYTITSPKTKSSNRILPMTEKVSNDLKIMYSRATEFADFKKKWFVFGNSLPFRETTICKKKNEYCKQANVKQIRIHDFRHSCASLLISKGASIALVSKYLGHGDISITLKTYTHMFKSELNEMVEILNKL